MPARSDCPDFLFKILIEEGQRIISILILTRYRAYQDALREMYENLSDFYESNNEDVEDVLFTILTTALFDKGKAELAKKINSLWTEQTENVLTVDECLTN